MIFFQDHKPNNENGNAIFLVLIAIMMLAALTYAVSNSDRGNINVASEERARLLASDILEYASVVANAVAQLRLRGCSETEISFENTVDLNYTNGLAPTDDSCDVFHPNGGGVSWIDPPQEAKISTAASINWSFEGATRVLGMGSDMTNAGAADLVLTLHNLSSKVCIQINELMDIGDGTSVPADGEYDQSPFIGNYSYNAARTIGDNFVELDGKRTGCSYDLANDSNTFYRVLVAR